MTNGDPILEEQLAYYRARASEYDASVQQTGRFAGPGIPNADKEWQHMVGSLRALDTVDSILELACGTGLWTRELVDIGKSVVALDGAPEMLEVNRGKLGSPRVRYQQVDLFQWKADAEFDLVFFAFWISHVPTDRMAPFLAEVAKAIRPGGRVFIVDEPAGGKHLSGPIEGDSEQTRVLHDGSTFKIVKVYHEPQALEGQLSALGFRNPEVWVGDYYFTISAIRE